MRPWSRLASSLLVVVLAVVWPSTITGEKQSQPQVRRQEEKDVPPIMASMYSAEKYKFLQNIFKNGLQDPVGLMASVTESAAFQRIYDNVEIQHRILEASPQLAALPGFRKAMGRRLNEAETTESFKEGVQALLELARTTTTTVQDAAGPIRVLNDMIAAGNTEIRDQLIAARAGDEISKDKIRRVLAATLFPGVDTDLLDELHSKANFDRILKQPDLMHYIDQDKYMSEAFRAGIPLPSKWQPSTTTEQSSPGAR